MFCTLSASRLCSRPSPPPCRLEKAEEIDFEPPVRRTQVERHKLSLHTFKPSRVSYTLPAVQHTFGPGEQTLRGGSYFHNALRRDPLLSRAALRGRRRVETHLRSRHAHLKFDESQKSQCMYVFEHGTKLLTRLSVSLESFNGVEHFKIR